MIGHEFNQVGIRVPTLYLKRGIAGDIRYFGPYASNTRYRFELDRTKPRKLPIGHAGGSRFACCRHCLDAHEVNKHAEVGWSKSARRRSKL